MVIIQKAIYWEAEKNKIWEFLKSINIDYKNISFYILAFIHKSIVNERPDYAPEHNERLEFLWDAVLELVITDALYHKFPDKPEWDLTDIRSALVRWKNLAKIANKLNFSKYLFLGKWEEKNGWRENNYILANTVEAVIWAIYLDLWIEKAKDFILTYIFSTLDEILKKNLTKDFKTIFQEFAQAKYNITPSYKILSETWPDHNKIYKVWVYLWEKQMWVWTGSSKKKAQEQSAKDAYLKFKN